MKKSLLAGMAAAASMAIAAPALATGTAYTVQVGSLPASSGDQRITAASTSASIFSSRGYVASCASANVPSDLENVVTNSPTTRKLSLLALHRINFVGCSHPGGSVTRTQIGTWELHGVSGVTSGSTDVVSGHLDHVRFSTSNLSCRYIVGGTATAAFDEAKQTLSISETGSTGNLKVEPGAACGSNVVSGQAFNLTATLQVKVAGDQRINIKP